MNYLPHNNNNSNRHFNNKTQNSFNNPSSSNNNFRNSYSFNQNSQNSLNSNTNFSQMNLNLMETQNEEKENLMKLEEQEKIAENYKNIFDYEKLLMEYIRETSDKNYYIKNKQKKFANFKKFLEEEFNITENLENFSEEKFEKIKEKEILDNFLNEKLHERITSDIKNYLKEKNKPKEENVNVKVTENENEENFELEKTENFSEKNEKNNFSEEIKFEEFDKKFFDKIGIRYKDYIEYNGYLTYEKNIQKMNLELNSNNSNVNAGEKKFILKPNFFLAFLVQNTKSKKVEKFVKENIPMEKLDYERNCFIENISNKEKNKEVKNKVNNEVSFKISEEDSKYEHFIIPYYICAEEILKEKKESEIETKRLKNDLFNLENSNSKIFSDRLEIKKRLNKSIMKIENLQSEIAIAKNFDRNKINLEE